MALATGPADTYLNGGPVLPWAAYQDDAGFPAALRLRIWRLGFGFVAERDGGASALGLGGSEVTEGLARVGAVAGLLDSSGLYDLERGEKRVKRGERPMGSYEDAVRTLEVELRGVEQAFRDLTPQQWQTPTKLQPLDDAQPPWTLFELAGHFDISIGLTVMLMAEPQQGQVGRDRASFFIFPRSEVAPVVYDYAFKMVEGKTPEQMPDVLHETFTKTTEGARAMAPDTIGPGYYALMRLDEFVPSRVVEAVVHGLDITDAVGREPIATPEGTALTAAILDDLLARKTVAGRPADLADDMAWVRAASGRAEHADPRLPLVG